MFYAWHVQLTLKIESGMFFGEGALMAATKPAGNKSTAADRKARQRRRNASVQAITFCYLFELAATDFEEVRALCCGTLHPDSLSLLVSLCALRR